MLLSQTKALLQEEVNSLQSKVEKLSGLQAENAALAVQVESLEKENQEESIHMQELLQQNVHLELDRDNKYVLMISVGLCLAVGACMCMYMYMHVQEIHVYMLEKSVEIPRVWSCYLIWNRLVHPFYGHSEEA